MKIFIDGKYYDEKNAKISVFDHGLLYGDGVFEGIRAYNGRVFKLKEHIDRLYYSAKAILLSIPMSHAQMMKAVVETCRGVHRGIEYDRVHAYGRARAWPALRQLCRALRMVDS